MGTDESVNREGIGLKAEHRAVCFLLQCALQKCHTITLKVYSLHGNCFFKRKRSLRRHLYCHDVRRLDFFRSGPQGNVYEARGIDALHLRLFRLHLFCCLFYQLLILLACRINFRQLETYILRQLRCAVIGDLHLIILCASLQNIIFSVPADRKGREALYLKACLYGRNLIRESFCLCCRGFCSCCFPSLCFLIYCSDFRHHSFFLADGLAFTVQCLDIPGYRNFGHFCDLAVIFLQMIDLHGIRIYILRQHCCTHLDLDTNSTVRLDFISILVFKIDIQRCGVIIEIIGLQRLLYCFIHLRRFFGGLRFLALAHHFRRMQRPALADGIVINRICTHDVRIISVGIGQCRRQELVGQIAQCILYDLGRLELSCDVLCTYLLQQCLLLRCQTLIHGGEGPSDF